MEKSQRMFTPQSLQAEETNYFLDSHIRQMLSVASLPELVWPLLQRRAVFLRNATNGHLHSSGKSTYEQIHGEPPDLSTMHIMGSIAYYRDEAKTGKHTPDLGGEAFQDICRRVF